MGDKKAIKAARRMQSEEEQRTVQAVLVPVETMLDLIELATARGMQRGSQLTLDELRSQGLLESQEKAPEARQSPFLDRDAHEQPERALAGVGDGVYDNA